MSSGGRSFRAASTVFGAATVILVALFVSVLVRHDEIRSGLATYAAITGTSAIGLWRRRGWGRSLALLITLASAGLGILTLVAVILEREGSLIVPVVVLVLSVAMAYWLSRPSFEVPRSVR